MWFPYLHHVDYWIMHVGSGFSFWSWFAGHGMKLPVTTAYGNRYTILTFAVATMLWRTRELEQLERLKMRFIRLTTLKPLALTTELHSKEPTKVCEFRSKKMIRVCEYFGLLLELDERQVDSNGENLTTFHFLRWSVLQKVMNKDEISTSKIAIREPVRFSRISTQKALAMGSNPAVS